MCTMFSKSNQNHKKLDLAKHAISESSEVQNLNIDLLYSSFEPWKNKPLDNNLLQLPFLISFIILSSQFM